MSGAIKDHLVQGTLSNASIGEMHTDVKLLGEIISAFSPPNELLCSSSTGGRMDPAGLEPASATWTECYVPITPRALKGSCHGDSREKVEGHNLARHVPNWERTAVVAELFHSKNVFRRDHRIAMNRHRVFHSSRVAARVGHHHGNIPCLGHTKYELVALL